MHSFKSVKEVITNCDATQRVVRLMLTSVVAMMFIFQGAAANPAGQGQDSSLRRFRSGFQLATFSSGNGHGTFIMPGLTFGNAWHEFALATLIHKRSNRSEGVRASYRYNITGDTDLFTAEEYYRFRPLLQMNFLSYVQCSRNLPLSYNTVIYEVQCNNTDQVDINQIRLSTVESGVGFELQMNINRWIKWRNQITLSVYHHTDYKFFLDHSKTGTGLGLGSAIQISLN
jgi:hypothetical protein